MPGYYPRSAYKRQGRRDPFHYPSNTAGRRRPEDTSKPASEQEKLHSPAIIPQTQTPQQ